MIMKINRDNYEAFFIDYLDGNLGENLVDEFLEFLQINPDLKAELHLVQSVSLKPEKVLFTKKELLMKEKYDLDEIFEETAVALLEGDISAEEKVEFERYLSTHPENQKQIGLFAKTKLIPDETIVFSKKSKLYHRTLGRTVFLWSARAAAVLLLALAVYWFMDETQNPLIPENKIAQVENENGKDKAIAPVETEIAEKVSRESSAMTPIKPLLAKRVEFEKPGSENNIQNLPIESRLSNRASVEIPDKMDRLTASLDVSQTKATLETMYITVPNISEKDAEERLLADIVIEKTGLDKLSLNNIAKAGLNLVSNITRDKFQYETNGEGKITTVNLDTRLLAFTIPVKNSED